jgi:nicotinamidase-related amidase
MNSENDSNINNVDMDNNVGVNDLNSDNNVNVDDKIEGDTLNVLVVVDVQDCFMSNILNDDNLLNFGIGQADEKKLELSGTMVKKIAELSKDNQIVVFTRDMHPQNHISFEGDEGRPLDPVHGYWPHHCRTDEICNIPRITDSDTTPNNRKPNESLKSVQEIIDKNPNISKEFAKEGEEVFKAKTKTSSELMVKGNQLSYFFYFTPLADTVVQLNDPNTTAISLKSNINNNTPNIGQINFTSVQPIDGKFYSLFKGERCNYESYSAFNYHLEYNMTRYNKEPTQAQIDAQKSEIIKDDETAKKIVQWKNVQKPIPIVGSDNKKYTTGLFEFIIQEVTKNPDIKTINFNICGLTGDVCVMHSAIQGSLLWEKTYKELLPEGTTCNFNVELAATAFLGDGGYKPTQAGYYKNTSDKNAALEEYKKFYKSETEGYVDNVDDAKYSFVLDKVDASTIASLPPPPTTEPPTLLPPIPPEKQLVGGRKRTRRNRKLSMHKKHKQNCNCKFCLYGGGKRKSMKKRRQTKKRRHRR